MQRLTNRIGLVLISSSLVLTGCQDPQKPDWNQQDDPQGANSGTGGVSGYHGSHFLGYHNGAGYFNRPGAFASNGSYGTHTGTSFSHSTSSARGGFGGSAHAGGS